MNPNTGLIISALWVLTNCMAFAGPSAQGPHFGKSSVDVSALPLRVRQIVDFSSSKLVRPTEIASRFKHDRSLIKVIVNLSQTSERQRRRRTAFSSPGSVKALQAEIKTRQERVLSSLGANNFQLRRRFRNQPGFSAKVTAEGLKKLLDDPGVESVEPVYTFKTMTSQGIGLINGTWYRSSFDGAVAAVARGLGRAMQSPPGAPWH